MSRLQEIKENAITTKLHDFFTEMPYEDFDWLIKQAEKAEQYEKEIKTFLELEPQGEDDWETVVHSIKSYLNGVLEGKW